MAVMKKQYENCVEEDGYNDTTRQIISAFLSAAAIAAAAYNSIKAVELATREWEIAATYWQLAQYWLQYYQDAFAPVEDQELAEARALKDETPDYVTARGRARAAAWHQFKGLTKKAIQCTTRYCTGRRKDALESLAVAQANALAMCDALGYRNERAYIEAKSDVRFQKQLGVAKRGRNMVADAPAFGAAAAGIYGQLYDQAWEGLKGAGTYLGYQMNRQRTHYPTYGMADLNGMNENRGGVEEAAARVSASWARPISEPELQSIFGG